MARDVPVAAPMTGVTKVGVLAKTRASVPVSPVTAVNKLAEEKEPSIVAFPVEVIAPVKLALVMTVAALPTEVTPPVKLALVMTVAALPTEVTPPVKLALVITVAAKLPVPLPVTPHVRVMV